MKAFIVFSAIIAFGACADDFCFQDTLKACSLKEVSGLSEASAHCNARYGAIEVHEQPIQKYANHLIYRSYDLLLMSTYYGNYLKNRPGFEKLYREMSDSLWQDGIDLIKFIDSRGGEMNFANIPQELLYDESNPNAEQPDWEVSELKSLAKALDIEKSIAEEAFKVHFDASNANFNSNDPEIIQHFEETYMSKQRQAVRRLAGYTHDLGQLVGTSDASLAVYMFDELLQGGKY